MRESETRDVVAIGASAGGYHVLLDIASRLPAHFPAAVLIVLHIDSHPSALPELLSASGPNPAVHPRSGQPLRRGTFYVAPPDHHLLVEGDSIILSRGPKEHHARPAIDPLFRSLAIACGPRVIGVVLSGDLDDGTAGAQDIKRCGGTIVVQDPQDAEVPSMPASVCTYVDVDHCVPRAWLAETLVTLVGTPVAAPVRVPAEIACEQRVSEGDANAMEDLDRIGKPSGFACPDCDGVLWEISDSQPRRFRCHAGHAFSLRSLEHAQQTSTNKSMWSSVRALQERAAILATMAADARQRGEDDEADRLEADANGAMEEAARLRAIAAG